MRQDNGRDIPNKNARDEMRRDYVLTAEESTVIR